MNIRHDVRPGDLGRVVTLHGEIYAAEHGYDLTFEGYVAATLGHFARPYDPARERLWLAEDDSTLVGCAAVINAGDAQFRWLLVAPAARGRGLGATLLREAVAFARAAGYSRLFLDTVDGLPASARLYRAVGFTLEYEKPPVMLWGEMRREQRHELRL
jgi:GNAT superfamily N-acetyltransferase